VDVVLSHIVKRFGRITACDDISLRLAPGRVHGLVGENGAGKSTLMRLLCGLLSPEAGTVVVDGAPLTRLTPRAAACRGIGMLPQDPLDFPALTVWENFALGGGPMPSRRQAMARLAAACRRLGLDLPAEAPVARLGLAERQQLELARLLDRGTRLLILDEPTTGISPAQRKALFAMLRDFVADGDRLAVLVTHKLAEALALCHEVSVLRQGRLVGHFDAPLDQPAILAAMFGGQAAVSLAEASPARPAGPLDGPALARLDDVTFVDDAAVLEHLDFTARPGEIVGLAGIAGSGQVVFLRGLAGLARAVAGRLTVSGRALAGQGLNRFLAAGIRSLPAARLEQGLFPGLSPLDHLRLAFPGQGRDAAALFRSRCRETFRLTDTPNAPAASLSGGNQQRLLLSLIPDDTVLLLADNPTRGLDAASVAQVWEHFRERSARGTTIIFASEDLDEIQARADRILLFFNRRIVADLPGGTDPNGAARPLGDLLTGLVDSGQVRT
jgi:simple sugar transport system ATP-binding protein